MEEAYGNEKGLLAGLKVKNLKTGREAGYHPPAEKEAAAAVVSVGQCGVLAGEVMWHPGLVACICGWREGKGAWHVGVPTWQLPSVSLWLACQAACMLNVRQGETSVGLL